MSTEAESGHERGLRRELRFWEAIALSIGIMAPGAAMALNGTLPASLVGRAVPLAFLFASMGILFVSYAFIRLTGYYQPCGVCLCPLRRDPRSAGRLLLRLGAFGHLHGLHRRVHRRGGSLRAGLLGRNRHLAERRMARDLPGGGRSHLVCSIRGRQGSDPRAAEYGGAYRHADRDRRRSHLRQGVRRHGSERSELHALPLHAAKRSWVGYCRPGRGLRASLVRGFRGGSLSR